MFICEDICKLSLRDYCGYLIFADPPRNKGMNEGASDDKKLYQDYVNFNIEWLRQAHRISAMDSWFIVTTDSTNRFLIESLINRSYADWELFNEIIWVYNFGRYRVNKFIPSHDTILIYRKGTPNFYPEQIKIPSQRMLSGDPRADYSGRVPGDVWYFSRQPGNSKQRRYIKTPSRSTLPSELCERIVKAFTKKESEFQLIVDLFSGYGTMEEAAINNGRSIISVDICQEYINEARERVNPYNFIYNTLSG